MEQVILQLLQSCLRLLAFGQVSDETGKQAAPILVYFADRQLNREGAAVPALTDDDPADADNAPLAGRQVTLHVRVVLVAVRRWYQHVDVAPVHFTCAPAEQSFRGFAELVNSAMVVDHDHGVGHGCSRAAPGVPGPLSRRRELCRPASALPRRV